MITLIIMGSLFFFVGILQFSKDLSKLAKCDISS